MESYPRFEFFIGQNYILILWSRWWEFPRYQILSLPNKFPSYMAKLSCCLSWVLPWFSWQKEKLPRKRRRGVQRKQGSDGVFEMERCFCACLFLQALYQIVYYARSIGMYYSRLYHQMSRGLILTEEALTIHSRILAIYYPAWNMIIQFWLLRLHEIPGL